MSYFDDASLVMIPSGTKTSKVYSVKPIDGTGDLTFSRSNDTATRVASNGLIERVRTNLALQSQTFDNASWVKAFATITANATTAPDGTLTADKLIANIGYDPVSATGNLRQTNIVATNTHTVSLYAKAAEFTSIRFRENFIVGSFLTIDLTNGSITGAGSQYINPTATAVGDGWYRISFVTPATADLDKYSIRVANTGDGTSGVFIWGFQYEVSDFGPTDYIATTSAAVSVGPVANVPRLDYLGSSCPRLLLEPQRTNIGLFSENFDNAVWTKASGTTVTANQAISPDGYQNADLVTFSLANTEVRQTFTGLTATTSTASIYLKAATGQEGNTVEFGYANANKVVHTLTNEWVRVSVTQTNAFNNNIYLGNYSGQTATGILVWGFQLESSGAAYATSYIPTLGAAVTRGADAAEKTGISSLIGQTEGTLFLELDIVAGSPNYHTLMQIYGNLTNRIAIGQDINSTNVFMYINGGGTASYQVATVAAGPHKIALAYKNGDSVLYIDGAAAITTTRAISLSTSLSTLFLNNVGGGEIGIFKDSQALVFKTRLSNAQLAELTTL
jgi:hypothetical protein